MLSVTFYWKITSSVYGILCSFLHKPQSAASSVVGCGINGNDLGHQHKKIAKRKAEEQPLPCPFELPRNYLRMVQDCLNMGILTGKARTKFISSVASVVFRYKNYPTKEEYDHVTEQVVNRYPFMKFGPGRGHVSCFTISNTMSFVLLQTCI